MKPIIKKIECGKLNKIEIITLGDLHLGAKECNLTRVGELIEKVRTKKNMYCIINGDLLDNAITSSVGSVYENVLSPMEQVRLATNILNPIKDKILAITSGNHEHRTSKTVGVDLMEFVAQELGLLKEYRENTAVLILRLMKEGAVRGIPYTLFISHGGGAGSTVGGKLNRLNRFDNVVDNADIYIGSHTHQAGAFPTSVFRVDERNNNIKLMTKLFVSNGSTLDYGGYAERFALAPNNSVYPIIYLNCENKQYGMAMDI